MIPNMLGAYGQWAAKAMQDPARLSFRQPMFGNVEAWRAVARARFRDMLMGPGAASTPVAVVSHHFDFEGLSIEHVQWQLPFGPPTEALVLKPASKDNIVRLKVANLCAENPLEWPELDLRTLKAKRDDDFKWMYRLLKPEVGTYQKHLGKHGKLPVPVLTQQKVPFGGLTDCTGKKITVASL